MRRLSPFAIIAACAVSSLALPTGAPAAPPDWEGDILKFEADDRERQSVKPVSAVDVVFLGSSSIRLWPLAASFPDLKCLNRGFGGSQMADAAEYAERILAAHQPRAVVVYSGDNDIAAGKTPEQIRDDFDLLVRKIRLRVSEARIVLISIKPSLKRWSLIDSIRQANGLLAARCKQEHNLEFVDVEPEMLGGDGLPRKELLVEDGLHLSPEGYQLWTKLTAPFLKVEQAKTP